MAPRAKAGPDRLRDRALAIGRDVAADFQQLELFTYANAVAFCVLFALVPFALFVVALLGFLDLTVLWTRDVAPGVAAIVGPSVFGVLDETVGQILATRQGYWLTAGLALTIWELSNAVFAVGGALNRIYRMSEERPLWRQLGESIVLGIAAGTCLLGTLAVAQVVPALVERALGPGAFASVLGFIAQWGVAVAAMLLVVSILIRYAPAEPVNWRWVSTGALVTVGSWTLTSIGFSAYISGLVNYGSLFGGLALPFVLLLYLYVAALALLLGVWVERRQRMGGDRPVQSVGDAEDV
ncbi:MAG: YihY/virulence factor BrkB family protein [Thermoleophilaceae bacterium]|nr:YihY/virulence factor BrkB family protein [Thermoleophilaceae bacterium]